MIVQLKGNQTEELQSFLIEIFGHEIEKDINEHIASMFSKDLSQQTFFIQKDKDKIIASISITKAAFSLTTWGIGWVAVHPDYRKRGLATNMIDNALKKIAQRISSTSHVILSTYPRLTPLYEKIGFKGTTNEVNDSVYLLMSIEPD